LTADCGLRTADCGLPTADCGLWNADCRLYCFQGEHKVRPYNLDKNLDAKRNIADCSFSSLLFPFQSSSE
jgi:hypothetical protein